MELKQLRQKSADELKSHLLDLHKEQFSLRMQKATGQLTKTHDARRVRREIARVNTLLGQPQSGKTK
ncbi:50S ribosomal protein L29 [Luteimonas sp. 50]|jgi:large subunit ribosomal protein L29|uniref:Large ribosomal subunit protein uL29 n=1 Tax=Cognatiluteimonas sedimenti TaxID=2927791 RepID=A0ABT0A2Y5_9GAMM|nr:50S ribosomal protein L29 [Lysobacter sedimenti]MCJ0825337.1 50S ribosomal protein L29 [Lysobacter sedimenti]